MIYMLYLFFIDVSLCFASSAAQQRFSLKHPAAVFYAWCFAEAGGTWAHPSASLISGLLSKGFWIPDTILVR